MGTNGSVYRAAGQGLQWRRGRKPQFCSALAAVWPPGCGAPLIRIKADRRDFGHVFMMSDAQAYRDLARRYREWAEVSNTTEREQRLRLATQLEELARAADAKAEAERRP